MPNIMNIIGVFRVQGKVISFNGYDNSGSVIADNGIQYVFSGNSWIEKYVPKAGDNIDFSFDSDTGSISRIAYQPYTSTPPPKPPHLSNDVSNNNGQQLTSPSLQKASQDSSILSTHGFNNQNVNNQLHDGSGIMYAQEDNYNIVDWTKKVILNNYLNFNGRARRKEYWWSYLAFTGVMIGAMIIDDIIGSNGIFYTLSLLGLLLPSFGVTVRRLHDTGRSGWNILWGIIPIIGAILLIIWLATDTSPQTNKWGAPSKRV